MNNIERGRRTEATTGELSVKFKNPNGMSLSFVKCRTIRARTLGVNDSAYANPSKDQFIRDFLGFPDELWMFLAT